MLFGLAFYRLGETDIDLFGYDKKLSKALYASEAGIDKVRWMIREVAAGNPYSNAYNEATAISIANPTGGDFFPGEEDKAYFKVSMIQDASILVPTEPKSKVRVKVLGSVDVDSDGEAGLTASEDVFTYDPDDVNRRFEAYIGLPGTLGERIGEKGISAAAGAFYAGGIEVPLSSESRVFITPDGDSIKDRNGNDRVIALDQYDRIADNLYAIGKTLEALRGIERWGGGQILDRAFTGFTALPSPEMAGGTDPYELLGISPEDNDDTRRKAYRKALSKNHPDHNGDPAIFDAIKKAGAQIGISR